MKDSETLKTVQEVIETLANGVNYFTGEEAGEDDMINDVRIVRALFAANEVLNEVIGKQRPKRERHNQKPFFVYDEEIIKNVKISSRPVSLSEIVSNILAAYNFECRLTYYMVAEILYREGILEYNKEGFPRYKASENAKRYGIWSQYVYRRYGERLQTFYDDNGQRCVLKILKKCASCIEESSRCEEQSDEEQD